MNVRAGGEPMANRVPFVDYLVLGDDHLCAKECSSCGALFLDRRNACAQCGKGDFRPRRLSNTGRLRAYTIVHRAAPDVKTPYVSVIVDLTGGGTVKANLVDVDPSPTNVHPAMLVQLTTFVIGTDPDGAESIGFGYRPTLAGTDGNGAS
jgi:uncharacterized protein